MKNRIVVCTAVLLAACALFVSCSNNKEEKTDNTDPVTQEQDIADTSETTGIIPDIGYWEEGVELTEKETPYMTFDYPVEWQDKFTIVPTQTDECYTLSFNGTGELSSVCAFSVSFGDTQELTAAYLGSYTDGSGTVDVYVNVPSYGTEYSDEQLNTLYELQGYVNDIIVQIQHKEGFTKR